MPPAIYVPDSVSVIAHETYVEVIVRRGSNQLREVVSLYDNRQIGLKVVAMHLKRIKLDEHLTCLTIQSIQSALALSDQLSARKA